VVLEGADEDGSGRLVICAEVGEKRGDKRIVIEED
jgi:hypothetical protein